jgi:hypothetical protein
MGNHIYELSKTLFDCSEILKQKNLTSKIDKKNEIYFIAQHLKNLISSFEEELSFLENVKTDTIDFEKYLNIVTKMVDEYEEILKCNINNLDNPVLLKHLKNVYNDLLTKTKCANVFNYYHEQFYDNKSDDNDPAS